MGFSISWIGFRATEAPAILRTLNLHILQKVDAYNEAPFSFANMPSGWTIIFSNDPGWASFDRLAALSAGREIIGMIIEEHTDIWGIYDYINGQPSWYVVRETTTGKSLLHSDGAIPDIAKPFLTQAWRNQEEKDNTALRHYPSHEPVDIAEAITGYRHDRYGPDGNPAFHVLEAGFTAPSGGL
ncbi:MAG: hypothetical protein QM647_14835 [Asticcacaulis sp.]|uniref:hypothetical protein n=1 Tax=Asticcacaulis sp. TaxID=1872648 RepID=UPI0039E3BC1B